MKKALSCIAYQSKEFKSDQPSKLTASAIHSKWPDGIVTYKLTNESGDIPDKSWQHRIISQALTTWGLRITKIKFKRIRGAGTADISIKFTHSDPYFKSPSTLAYGYYPNPKTPLGGDIVFNDNVLWSSDGLPVDAETYTKITGKPVANPKNKFKTMNLLHVAIHEVGHALGLKHSEGCPDCIMHPFYHNDITLAEGDIESIQAAYGARKVSEKIIDGFHAILKRGNNL